MGESEFYIDYEITIDDWNKELQNELERKLQKLASEQSDIIGAAVSVRNPAEATTPYLYQTRIVLYARPEEIVAVETADSVKGSVSGAVSAVVRQVREKREKLGEPWKRKDFSGTPGESEM